MPTAILRRDLRTNAQRFSYDALGRRMSRTPAGGSTTDTQFMGSEPLTESVGGTYTAAYAYGNDQLRRNGEYPQFDGTGSVRGETSSSQAVTYTQNTDSFGNQVGSSGSTSSSAKFAGDWGYQTDGDAGLVHVGARYYDPQVGSFATRDTLLDQIPYAYCGHDPVDWVDPSGHGDGDGVGAGVGGIIGGAIGGLIGGLFGGVGAVPGAMIGGGIGAALGGWIGGNFIDRETTPELIHDGLWNFGWGMITCISIVKAPAIIKVVIIVAKE